MVLASGVQNGNGQPYSGQVLDVGTWRFTCSWCNYAQRSPNAIVVTVVQPPELTVSSQNCDWRNSSLTVTLKVTAPAGWPSSDNNSYQYYVSTSASSLENGSWTNYTKDVNNNISLGSTSGTYYIFVKRVHDANSQYTNINNVTIGSTQYHRFGPYKFDYEDPTYTSYEIKNVTKDGYDVYVYGVSDGHSGINRVQFPTWTTTNNQDDITWGSGTNKGSGTWYFRVNASDHNNEEGYYNTHIYIYDNVGNSTSGAADTVFIDRTSPTMSVSTKSCSWRNSAISTTITVEDPISNGANSGLSGSNSYQYFLSNSPTELSGGAWKNYTSGTAISLEPESKASGTYYLFVKRVKDNAENASTSNGTNVTINGTTYHRYGTYQFDYDRPTWEYASKDIYYSTENDAGNDDYANRERTVKITFKGKDTTSNAVSSLTSEAISVYVNGTEVTSVNKSLTTTNNSTKEVTCVLTIKGITGDGTLNVVIPSDTLTDEATNTNVQTELTTNITIDNVNPNLTLAIASPAEGYYNAGQTITITATYNEDVYKEITSKNLIDTISEAPAMSLKFGSTNAKGTVTCTGVNGRVITYTYTIQGPTTIGGTDGDNGKLVIKSLGTVYDAAGNGIGATNATTSVSIFADTRKPTLVVSPSSTPWRNSALSVKVTHNDNGGSGFATTGGAYFLSTNGNPTSVATETNLSGTYTSGTTFSINPGTSGTYYLFVKEIVDKLGNISSAGATDTVTINGVAYHKYGTYLFDYDNPTAGTMTMKIENSDGSEYSNDTWTYQNVYVELNDGSDALSGHNSTTYTVNNGEATTTPQTISAEGINTVKVTTKDNAGNKATNTYTVKIDRTPPTITVDPTSHGWKNSALGIKVTQSDIGGSGPASTSGSYFLSTEETPSAVATEAKLSGTYTSGTTFYINPGENGIYYLFVKEVADNVGNISSTGATDTVTIDGVAYHRYGTYYFEYDKPTWSYVSKDIYYKTEGDVGNDAENDDKNANRERTVKITFKGQDITTNITSTLTSDDIVVSANGTPVANENKSLEITGDTTNPKEITYVLTIKKITGDGTLKVVIPRNTLTDEATNTNQETALTTYIGITIDNTNPNINFTVKNLPAGAYKAGQTITIVATYNENIYQEITSNNLIDIASAPVMEISFGGVASKGTVTCTGVNGRVITYTYTIQGPETPGGTDGDNGILEIKSLGKVYDAAGNAMELTESETTSPIITADTIPPTLTVEPTSSTEWRNTALSITAIHEDIGGSGFETTEGAYFLSTNENPRSVATGEKLSGTYTSGEAFSINPETSGRYYLFVKEKADKAGNTTATLATNTVTINGVKYHKYGTYLFDYDGPIWSAQNLNLDRATNTVTVDLVATDDISKNAASGLASASLTKEDLTIYIDGIELTDIEKTLSEQIPTENGVKYTLTLTGFNEDKRQSGKNFLEWSGTVSVDVAEGTAIDNIGNTSEQQSVEIGLVDFIKPEFTYQYKRGDINYGDKTLKVVFDVTDKYFNRTSLSTDSDGSLITVKVDDDPEANNAVTKTLTKTNDIVFNTQTNTVTIQEAEYTLGENEKKVGERYELIISNLQQDPNDGIKYSGIVTLGFGAGIVTDTSRNGNNVTKITIGVNEPAEELPSTGLPSTDYTRPYLPDGYSYVEGDLNTGLVIADSIGNEYVWVEVPKTAEVYKNAGLNITDFTAEISVPDTSKEDGSTILVDGYRAIEIDLHDYTSVYRNGTSFTDTYYSDEITGLTETQYNELKQKMLRSVYQNGGFYVGRYEAGIEDTPRTSDSSSTAPTETAVIKRNAYPYNYVTCSQAQTLASGFASQLDGYTSSLMFGVQWDLVLKYLETKGATQDELNSDSTNWGNYKNNNWTISNESSKYGVYDVIDMRVSSWNTGLYNGTGSKGDTSTPILLSTGASDTFRKQAIYDLAGNVREHTLEGHENTKDDRCVTRGGTFGSVGDEEPAEDRTSGGENYKSTFVGFRVALYKDVDFSLEGYVPEIVDVVDPAWTIESSTVYAIDPDNKESSTATITFRGADKYLKESTPLTEDDIQVIVNGEVITDLEAAGITKTLDETKTKILTEERLVDGVTKTVQYGVEYTVTIKGFAQDVNQVKLRIPEGKLTDKYGNKSKMTDLIAYSTLRYAGEEKTKTSPFLGESLSTTIYPTGLTEVTPIARQDIERVEFVSSIAGSKAQEVQRIWDVSAQGDKSIIAWTEQTQAPYTVYIGSNYEIFANQDSTNLFSYIGYGTSCTATEAITNLNLLNVKSVTNMSKMFNALGYTAMTSLTLPITFDISNVTNMSGMFNSCGYTAMTSLDLGPTFTKIAETNTNFFTEVGKSGECTIYAPEAIYKNKNAFKLNSTDGAETPNSLKHTRGTINPIYKPEWKKVSSSINTTNKTLSVVVKGSAYKIQQTIDNGNVKINYASDVTSQLSNEHITVYIDGVEVTSTVTPTVTEEPIVTEEPMVTETPKITVNEGTTSTNSTSKKTEVTHTITLSNLEEAIRQTGKPYKEWSGNIAIRIGGRGEETSTYTANVLTDIYGNQSMMQTDEGQTDGTWIDVTIKDEETNQNTANTMFADYIKPEFAYKYNEGDINYGDKTLKVVFDVTDKYFANTSLATDINASLITVKVAEDPEANNAVTKTLTKTHEIILNTQTNEVTAQEAGYTPGENERKIGERYELVIEKLQQEPNDGFKYSGIVTLGFGVGVVTDTSGNQNNATIITIGVNDEDGNTQNTQDPNGVIVDVVDPIWKQEEIDAGNLIFKLTATDKYFDSENSNLTAEDIKIYLNGIEIPTAEAEIINTTDILETVDGVPNTVVGREYTIKLSNVETAETGYTDFIPSNLETDNLNNNVGFKYKEGILGNVAIEIKKGVIKDKSNNTSQAQTFDIDIEDNTKPEVFKVEEIQDTENKTETIIFNVIDKNYDETADVVKPEEIIVLIDGTPVNSINKSNLTSKPIMKETKIVGHQYTLVLSNIVEKTRQDGKSYLENSGTVGIKIAPNAVIDKYGNTVEDKAINGFVDFIKPELRYTHQSTDINTGSKRYTMTFVVTDKYYTSGVLELADLTIKMKNGQKDANGNEIVYDLRQLQKAGEVSLSLKPTEKKATFRKTVDGVLEETATEHVIGHTYVLTVSGLDRGWIKGGQTTANYSGIITVGIEADKVQDNGPAGDGENPNGNNATKITSGVNITDESGNEEEPGNEEPGVVVDVVSPLFTRVGSSASAIDPANKASSIARLTFRGTDTYFKESTLTIDDIKVIVNGEEVTDLEAAGITKTLDSTVELKEDRIVDGVEVTDVQYGVQYAVTIKGFAQDAKQVKVRIPAGKLTDETGNSNRQTDFILYNTLKRAASETDATSPFLGGPENIQRQDIENITFVNSNSGLIRYYDAKSNALSGHDDSATTWRDLNRNKDGIVNGGTWGDDYLALDGIENWVDLGKIGLSEQVTLNTTITVNEIQDGERAILSNSQEGGVGIYINSGVPKFKVYIEGTGDVSIEGSEAITVDEKTRLTATYDGNYMSLYVNGELVAQKEQTGAIGAPANNTVMAIGANPDGDTVENDSFANINVYSAKIYNKGLTPAEVKQAETSQQKYATWDVSAQQDGSIMAWTYDTSAPYTVYISSNYEIFANQDSSNLFRYIGYGTSCTATEAVTNLNLLNVRSVTRMYAMFYNLGYIAMTSLDLGDKFDTSNVTNMSYMFDSCGYTAMTSLDLGGKFDTSEVTEMRSMFGYCGYTAMTSLNLGDKFNTSNVTDMQRMFRACGYTAMTTLDLGDLFYTTNVKDMYFMFNVCGKTVMINLDLGPAFTNIPTGNTTDSKGNTVSANGNFLAGTGSSGCTIYAPESIYKNKNAFKLGSSDTTETPDSLKYTRGTINPIYKPEWEKVSSSIDTENKTLSVTVKGSAYKTKTEQVDGVDTIETIYASNVTSRLSKEHITVFVDGVEVTKTVNPIVTESPMVTVNAGETSTNSTSKKTEVTHTITLSNLEEAIRQTGKPYKEWSGNIAIRVGGRGEATSTYASPSLVDIYGNQSMMQTDENGTNADGSWINVTFSETEADRNTENTMFMDYIKPEFTYKYNEGDINYGNKTLKVVFDVADKYFANTSLATDSNASLITVNVAEDPAANSAVTKTLTKTNDLVLNTQTNTVTAQEAGYTLGENERKVGERYELLIEKLEQNPNDGFKYSGKVTLGFEAGIIEDTSGNLSNATKITIGVNDTDGNTQDTQDPNGVIVDVVDPIWKLGEVDKENLTVKLIATDKYFDSENSKLTADDITIKLNGVEIPTAEAEITNTTDILETVDGVENTVVGKEYTIKLTNLETTEDGYIEFTPSNLQEDSLNNNAGFKYKAGVSGNITVEIAKGAIKDKSNNTNKAQSLDIEIEDTTKPEVFEVQKTQDTSAKTETIIFNVTDKNYDSTDPITSGEITVFIDGTLINSIDKSNLTSKPIMKETKIVGHQYTLVLSNIVETTRKDGKEYLENSGTIEVKIAENAARDLSGNGLAATTIKGFVDCIKPELRYTHQSTDINTGTKTYTMTFEITDKYYTSGQLELADLSIKMKNGQKDANGNEIEYDLRQLADAGEINVALTATEKTATFRKTVDGNVEETATSHVIGHTYKLVISNLEKVEIKSGLTTADYSGIVTVAVAADKVKDNGPAGDGVNPNGNNATTITSGVNIPGGSGVEGGNGVAIDVVDPVWTKVDSTAYAIDPENKESSTATITFKGTDTYFKESTLTIDDIQVVVNGSVVTSGITKTLDSTRTLTEDRIVNGVSKTGVKYGVEYTVTIKGFAQNANQVKIRIPAGKLIDESDNSNKETDLIVYNTLRYAGSETEATSPFLGGPADIQRQNIENVTFVNNSVASDDSNEIEAAKNTLKKLTSGLIRSYDAKNNTAIGHDNSTTSWRDLSGNRDGIVNGGTWTDEYLTLDGVDDWVNLGEVDLTDQVTLDVTIEANEIQDGGACVLGNWEIGGGGIYLTSGIPTFEMFIQNVGGYVKVSASKAITVGEKTRITGTYDGTNMSLYINGELVAQKAQTGKIQATQKNTVMAIGVNPVINNAESGGFANINVYSAKVYNTALTQAEINAWDVSAQQDGSIMAWATQTADQATRGVYTAYIGSNDEIFANQDSSRLFGYIGYGESCTATDAVTNLDLLNVKSVTNMSYMFQYFGYTAMTSFVLPGTFDTSNVTDMSRMFYGCGQKSMTKLELGTNFNTSNVTSMKFMFNACGYESMTSIDLGNNFDTSKVKNMSQMFKDCGAQRMTTLDLGDKFDTSNVTNMSYMFEYCVSLTNLNLGDKFDTSNVTDMTRMFFGCGAYNMTTLDLCPAFTKIAENNTDFLINTGKPGECTIYAPESIYKNKNALKLNSADTTETPDSLKYTRGTINPIYKPGWEKVSSSINTTDKTLSVTVKGSAYQTPQAIDNGKVTINYVSDVTSKLSKEHITVYIDGVEVTNTVNPFVTVNAGENSTNATTEKTEVTHTITLSNLEEAIRQTGKPYKEWSGNIAIRVGGRGEATSTYASPSLVDIYGNQSMMQTDEGQTDGTWINVTFKDEATDRNTAGTMFADYIKPEFTYKYNEGDINYGNKTLKVVFDVTDKYFANTSLATDSNASLITVKVSEDEEANNAVTKTLTKTNDLVLNTQTNEVTAKVAGYTLGENERKVGERYELLIKNLQQNPNDGFKYSGIVSLGFDAGIITDTSGNQNNATKITIGRNETGTELPSTEYTKPYLPTGYNYVGGNLDTGLIIADPLGNEYVWVEVPKTETVYKTAKLGITTFTDAEYTKIENDLHDYTTVYRNGTSYTDEFPDDLVQEATGLSSDQYKELKQRMLRSVYQNGGFYVGRYETGIENSYRTSGSETEAPTETAVIKQNAYPYNWVTGSQAQTLAKGFASQLDGYTSSLMFGVQWDLVLKYLETKGAATQYELNSKSTNLGNYNDTRWNITNTNSKYSLHSDTTWKNTPYNKSYDASIILTTGASGTFAKQNMYDLAGNVREITLEYSTDSDKTVVTRGNSYMLSSYIWSYKYPDDGPVSKRLPLLPNFSDKTTGFRTALFKDTDLNADNSNSNQTENGVIVDVVDPIWELGEVDKENLTIKLKAKDKYFDSENSNLTADDITIKLNGIEIPTAVAEITNTTDILETVDGVADTVVGKEYTIKLSNLEISETGYIEFTPSNLQEDSLNNNAGFKYKAGVSGNIAIEIAEGAIKDKSNNTSKAETFNMRIEDTTKPEVFEVQKTQNTSDKTETIIFNVTDQNYDETDLITSEEITVFIDGTQINSIDKSNLTSKPIKETKYGETKIVGHQYTLVLSNIAETTRQDGKEYLENSGTLEVKIAENAARDLSGNKLAATTIKDFVDFIKPELRYTHQSTDINTGTKTYTMTFEITDKYYTSGELALADLTIKMKNGQKDSNGNEIVYDLNELANAGEINMTLNKTPKTATFDKTVNNVVVSGTYTIGHTYTLTVSNLEKVEIKAGLTTADYSGIITVGVAADKIKDNGPRGDGVNPNGNNATTITAGVNIPGGSGAEGENGVVVDVVAPVWTKVDSTAYAIDPDNKASSTATITFKGTDTYFKESTLTMNDIKVLVNGAEVSSGITKVLDSTRTLTEDRIENGANKTGVPYGVEYTITIKGFAQNAKQVKVRIPAGKLTDKSDNSNKETDLIVYNTLRSAASETVATSPFLGGPASIERQNIENVTFVNNSVASDDNNEIDAAKNTLKKLTSGLIRSYDAKNNTASGHDNSATTWRDLSGNRDGILNGGTWTDEYLTLDGVDDWVNLGEVSLSDQVTLDVTIEANEIQDGEVNVLANYELGGVGINLISGVPEFKVSKQNPLGYIKISASEAITIGEKTRITGTYDGTKISLYINGELVAQKVQTGKLAATQKNTVMAIGANPVRNSAQEGDFANINVYSAKAYNVALSQAEINAWDVSAQQDGSIMAWATQTEDQATRGVYTVYVGSNDEIFANQDSIGSFGYIGYGTNCKATEAVTNLDLLNVKSVKNMYGMFQYFGYRAMTSLILPTTFDTSNVTSTGWMFNGCGLNAMTKLELGTNFNTSNVTFMRGMFNNCGSCKLTKLDLSSGTDKTNTTQFNTKNVRDMSSMFSICGKDAMTSLNLGTNFYTTNVTNMKYMFFGTGRNSMTSLDLGDKFDTSNVTNMYRMFFNCGFKSMTSLKLGDKFNTSNVTDMQKMFDSCGYTAMTSLDLGDLFYTTNVKDMYKMFYNCGKEAMTSLDLGPAFTKIPSGKITKKASDYESWESDKALEYNAYDGFMTDCGTSSLVIYAPETIYLDQSSFKLNKTGQ